jgi:hypothetical protein
MKERIFWVIGFTGQALCAVFLLAVFAGPLVPSRWLPWNWGKSEAWWRTHSRHTEEVDEGSRWDHVRGR